MFQRCQMSDLWAEPRRTQPRPLMRATKSWCKGPPATNSVHSSFSPPGDWRMLTDTSGDVSGDQDCQTEGYRSRLRFSVCKRDTTGCFYVDLGTYNNQNWIFFVGSRAVSSCVCVDQNWIFLKWPGDIFISVCGHPNPISFKERLGHFQPCLWWQQHNYHAPCRQQQCFVPPLPSLLVFSPQAPAIWSVAWRTVKCQRESFTTGQFTFNTFNSERNPVPRLFSSPILINSGEITGSELQMWPRSGDSHIIRIRIIPFSQKWHISDDCFGSANPSLVLPYKWKCSSTESQWNVNWTDG